MYTTLVAAHDDTMRRLLWPDLWAESEFELTGMATDSSQALELVRRHRPDVVLIDPALPPLGGLVLVAALAIAAPETRSFLLPGSCRQATIDRAMAVGASGCFLDADSLSLAPGTDATSASSD